VGQTVAAIRPDLVKALVVSPPLPGAGQRVLELGSVKEFWYTSFHQLDLVQQLIDGNRDAVRAYLHHFWSHWSGPNYLVDEKRIDHLADVYSAPGAFIASVNWYRSSGNPVTAYAAETKPSPDTRLATPTTILWQDQDPIFLYRWSDQLDAFLPGQHPGKIGWDRAFYPARGDGSICRSHQATAHELILPSSLSLRLCPWHTDLCKVVNFGRERLGAWWRMGLMRKKFFPECETGGRPAKRAVFLFKCAKTSSNAITPNPFTR
jgi:hypothetical protein